MPGRFLTDADRDRLSRFPPDLTPADLSIYFTLTAADHQLLEQHRRDQNRLGVAVQLGALRFMGFCPDDLSATPAMITNYVAQQVAADPAALLCYGQRAQTRTDHAHQVQRHLGWRDVTAIDVAALTTWLVEQAQEHDKPMVLLQLATDKLYRDKLVRPGVTILERLVMHARVEIRTMTYHILRPLLTPQVCALLDTLLLPDPTTWRTPLTWLRQGTVTNSPAAIRTTIEKLERLRQWGVPTWQVHGIHPNRRKVLAHIGYKASAQALQRVAPQRRYPILIAFLTHLLEETTDEAIDLFIACMADAERRARREWKDLQVTLASTTNDKLQLLYELGTIILDVTIPDEAVRQHIYAHIPPVQLQAEVMTCAHLVRPHPTSATEFFLRRYGYIRQFSPTFLASFQFQSTRAVDPLLAAVALLQWLNETKHHKIPADIDPPTSFMRPAWRPYVMQTDGTINRHAYELCVLWELRSALRAGNVWLAGSRRYANPESYLIPRDQWPALRMDTAALLNAPLDGRIHLAERCAHLQTQLAAFDRSLPRNAHVRLVQGELKVDRLTAETLPDTALRLQTTCTEYLPPVELVDQLIEVDKWTGLSDAFEHAGGSEPRTTALRTHLYAAILAQGCNIGLAQMAQISNLSYDKLAWCTNWYLREETLRTAITRVVNFHHRLPLTRIWGDGTLSSTDGQRFPVSVKARNAVALPRYFGYGRGLTFLSWTSNQHNQYGTKVVPTTARDAAYLLDEILGNETELPILEHTVDTAGYTEVMFALFDLLGLQFAPRISDVGQQRLYRPDRTTCYRHIEPLLAGTIKVEKIVQRWDDVLRVAGSLKRGWVTASLFISKLESFAQQPGLLQVLQEYGRMIKTIFIVQYLQSEPYRRRINTQLNKGEALHALRQFLMFGNEGKLRQRHLDEQTNQASCLTLLTNIVITWNTVYMAAIFDQLRADGQCVRDADIAHLSPTRYEHINRYGKYHFNVEEILEREHLRPLRRPGNP